MTRETEVIVGVEGRIGTIEFNRFDGINVIGDSTLHALGSAVQRLKSEEQVDVVILRSASTKTFIMGADLTQMNGLSPEEAVTFSESFQQVCDDLEDLPQVTIAVMNGHTFGGGLEISLACDIRLAANTIRMALPEVSLGMIPGGGGTVRLTRVVGVSRALEMIVAAQVIDGSRAAELGLVNLAVDSDNLAEICDDLGKRILAQPSPAIRQAKAAIRSGAEVDRASAMRIERLGFGILAGTPESREGMDAFLNKRTPHWQLTEN